MKAEAGSRNVLYLCVVFRTYLRRRNSISLLAEEQRQLGERRKMGRERIVLGKRRIEERC